MPHQCTTCGHSFEDGSKAMLDGCPDCGGNTFQFYPAGTDVPDEPPAEPEEPPEEPGADTPVASTVGRATTKVRDFVSGGSPEPDPDAEAPWPDEADPPVSGGDTDIIDADGRATEDAIDDAEDAAQATARTDVVSDDEIEAGSPNESTGRDRPEPPAGAPDADAGTARPTDGAGRGRDGDASGSLADAEGRVVSEPSDEEPDIQELREQLNAQFESIKILEPGQYELNLMELYDREEYIIALQENGRYVIQVPEQWMGDRPAE